MLNWLRDVASRDDVAWMEFCRLNLDFSFVRCTCFDFIPRETENAEEQTVSLFGETSVATRQCL